MRALVVDDEPLARRRLIRMLAGIPGVEVVGEAEDGWDARRKIRALAPEVVFLDIRMPGLDGLSLAVEDRGSLPPVVFTTAYDEYAVRAFETEAIDYLLKPVEPDRLRRAVDRVRRLAGSDVGTKLDALMKRLGEAQGPPRVSARHASTVYFFDPRTIARFRASDKYVAFENKGRAYLMDESINELERRLAPWGFIRVHRGELVNLRLVVALHSEGSTATLELTDRQLVPVSRRRLAQLRHALGLD